MLKRAAEIRRREGRINHQGYSSFMRNVSQCSDIQHFKTGVPDGLGEDKTGLRPDRLAEALHVARMHLRGLNAESRESMAEKIMTAAVKCAGCNNVRACPHQGDDGQMQRCVTAGRCDRTDTALKRRDTFFQKQRQSDLEIRE